MKHTWFRLIAFAVLFVLALASCDLFGDRVSISDRISRFESDLNNNPSGVFNNLHPSVQQYEASRDPAFWTARFPAGDRSFSISVAGGNTRTGVVNSRPGGVTGSREITLSFREDGRNNWKIDRIELEGASPNPFIFR